MKHSLQCAIALTLLVALPLTASAQRRGGGAGATGGGRMSAPAFRAPQPVMRAQPSAPNTGGFNFNRDINAGPAPSFPRSIPIPVQRPIQQRPVQQPPVQPRPVQQPPIQQRAGAPGQMRRTQPIAVYRGGTAGNNRGTPRYAGPPNSGSGGPYQGHFTGRSIPNPHHWSGSWGWNRGVAWQPAPVYWGGGFWGPWAFDTLGAAVLYGSIDDDQDQVMYPSYEVEPDSPGAQVLENYGLEQTPCGPPDLVVIWGPDNSVVCAFPNDTVGPGEYELDPSSLTIVSQQ